jgi:hypothetical protein
MIEAAPFGRRRLPESAAMSPARLRSLLVATSLGLLAACASYDGRGLRPGVDDGKAVRALMGEPAQQWTAADGSQRLAYPRGPEGIHTYMVELGPDGRLQHIGNVLDMAHFAQIRSGMEMDEVLQLIGPPQPTWTVYFEARDELVWEWLYCDDQALQARFDVLFDGSSRRVRSTLSRPDLRGQDGVAPSCGH